MVDGKARRYAPYGLILGLYASREGGVALEKYEEQIDRALREHKEKLRKCMCSVTPSRSRPGEKELSPETYLRYLYVPRYVAAFGRFDCGFVCLVDDYDVLPELADPPATWGQKFETGHLLEHDERSCLLWRSRDILGALRRHSCFAIVRLKLQIMFTSVLGQRMYDYVYDMCSNVAEHAGKDVSVLVCECLGWFDLLMVVGADCFGKLSEVLIPVHAASLEDLWKQLPSEDQVERRTELLERYGGSDVGRDIAAAYRKSLNHRKPLPQSPPCQQPYLSLYEHNPCV